MGNIFTGQICRKNTYGDVTGSDDDHFPYLECTYRGECTCNNPGKSTHAGNLCYREMRDAMGSIMADFQEGHHAKDLLTDRMIKEGYAAMIRGKEILYVSKSSSNIMVSLTSNSAQLI